MRTWTVELPAGIPLLTANQRPHWRARARLTKTIREAAYWSAKASKVPSLVCAHITVDYRPVDRRRRDPGNWAPSAKAAVDGLVDAGILPDDDAHHLVGPDMRLGDIAPKAQLILHIREIKNGIS